MTLAAHSRLFITLGFIYVELLLVSPLANCEQSRPELPTQFANTSVCHNSKGQSVDSLFSRTARTVTGMTLGIPANGSRGRAPRLRKRRCQNTIRRVFFLAAAATCLSKLLSGLIILSQGKNARSRIRRRIFTERLFSRRPSEGIK